MAAQGRRRGKGELVVRGARRAIDDGGRWGGEDELELTSCSGSPSLSFPLSFSLYLSRTRARPSRLKELYSGRTRLAVRSSSFFRVFFGFSFSRSFFFFFFNPSPLSGSSSSPWHPLATPLSEGLDLERGTDRGVVLVSDPPSLSRSPVPLSPSRFLPTRTARTVPDVSLARARARVRYSPDRERKSSELNECRVPARGIIIHAGERNAGVPRAG